MSKVPDQVLLPFKERRADWMDFDVTGLSPGASKKAEAEDAP
jgi:hypothetical protein